MTDIVVTKETHLAVQVTPEPPAALTVTPGSTINVVVPGPTSENLVVTQERNISVQVVPEPEVTLSVDLPKVAKTLVVSGDQAAHEVRVALNEHIYSATPHPAYDAPDGPSLLLLYQNAKV